jgi:hypothetical protein
MSIKIIKTIISVLDVLLLTIFGALAWGAHAVGSLLPSAKVAAGIYLVTELTFFVYEKLRHKKLNDAFLRPPDPGKLSSAAKLSHCSSHYLAADALGPLLTHQQPLITLRLQIVVRAAVAMKRFCDLKDVFGLEDFLEGWFFGTPAKSIPRGNIEEFVAFAFYQLKPENLSQEQHKDVDDLLERIQKWYVETENSSRNTGAAAAADRGYYFLTLISPNLFAMQLGRVVFFRLRPFIKVHGASVGATACSSQTSDCLHHFRGGSSALLCSFQTHGL